MNRKLGCFAAVVLMGLMAQSLPLTTKTWFLNGAGFPPLQPSNSPTGVSFQFPAPGAKISAPNYVDYVLHLQNTAISGSMSASFQIATTGAPVFGYATEPVNTCVYPAHARLYFDQNGFWNGGETYRWWSNPASFVLARGATTLTVPLTPDQWSDVYGYFGNADSKHLAAFQAALKGAYNVGIAFGGGCFFGHGVYVNGGNAQFTLTAFSVN